MTTEKRTDSPEMAEFNKALSGVMQYSKKDLIELLAKEKVANAGKPKRGPKKSRTLSHG